MTRALFGLLLLVPLAALAAPHLDLAVELNPDSRAFRASATLTDAAGLAGFRLAPDFRITSLRLNGKPATPKGDGRGLHPLPPGSRSVNLSYEGGLQPLAGLDHRQVLGALPAMASPEGSFLPSGAGWYPDPGTRFSYRVSLSLPPGQKGLVPGDLVKEDDAAQGYRAEFAFPELAEGIDLMAGPYAVAEQGVKLDSGRTIRVRTWFHAELAGLAPGYLDDSARYLQRYSRLIGDYPFALFSVVSSPLPTGFGMPSLTYLGRDVLRLPFIRATSLGHEVLHNWWGNGVYPDWRRGNWSEGLTTFLADYAYKEDQGEAAAREMRLAWLRDLTAVPEAEDTALRDFVSRHHGISSIVGYNKSAMVFVMLRDRIGRDAFERGLRLLWQDRRFRTASWADLEAAFSRAAGRSQAEFFRQWVDQPGSPRLRLLAAQQEGGRLRVTLSQQKNAPLQVPLRLVLAEGSQDVRVTLSGRKQTFTLPARAPVQAVQLDPDYRLWRRLEPALLPAILREVFVAPQAGLVVTATAPAVQAAARALAERVLDTAPTPLPASASGGTSPLLVVGTHADIDAWLAGRHLPARHEAARGSAQVWAGRDDAGRPFAIVSARDGEALKALERGLPHYGRQSWLVFDGARAVDKGVWPPQLEEIRLPANRR